MHLKFHRKIWLQTWVSVWNISVICSAEMWERIFARFLRRYRIEKAQELLLEGEISKDEVLYSVGFSDPKYFNKCFKEETGVNVTEFIKARR